MTQPAPEPTPELDEYEAWQDLQAVLEERDREYWAEQSSADDGG